MRAVVVAIAISFIGSLVGCGGDDLRANITIVSAPQWRDALAELVALTPYRGLSLGDDPGDGFEIEVVDVPTIPLEGYRLEQADDDTIRVQAHDVLGAQYGVAAALEAFGMRFRHPFDAYVPGVAELGAVDTELHQPDIRVRGLQLHTLHPIEGYFAFWEPSPGSTNDAHRIIDWVVKNRGNFLQWVPLDNILQPDQYEAWKPFTQELIDYAHLRGIRVGINIQLFGASNLQNAYDLVDKEMEPIAPQIAARLPLITKDLPFDVYTVSFGEFFNADPVAFIGAVNEMRSQFRTFAPQAEIHALIHVGEEQRITYMDENLIHYFLVKYADESIIHDVHTVMFYNLFEDAGGAYQHHDFSEHRAHLQQRMCEGKRTAYQPETAYWVAFDNSVPHYYPLYVHSRLLDLDMLQRPEGPCGTLDQHYLFSTGWEWGYWLNDVASLRASYELVSASDAIHAELAPDLGAGAAALVERMMNVQHELVLLRRLTGYLVGRDSIIDLGRQLDIVSQPDRVTFDQLVAGQGRAEVENMLPNLRAYADELDILDREVRALDLPDSRWSRELRDSFAINALRARFVVSTFEATLAAIDGDPAAAATYFKAAEWRLARARPIIAARHADLHDDHGRRLVDKTANQTFYQFGYLFFADNLCYWDRELVQVGGILGSTSAVPPSCFF